jgi:hypothetical protein
MLVLAIAVAAVMGLTARAPAGVSTLPPGLTQILLSNLDACFANTSCGTAFKQSLDLCAMNSTCFAALGAFFTANPLIAARTSGHASESLNVWIRTWASPAAN